MDVKDYYSQQIGFYTQNLKKNIKLYDNRGQDLDIIDLSFATLGDHFSELVDQRTMSAIANTQRKFVNDNLSQTMVQENIETIKEEGEGEEQAPENGDKVVEEVGNEEAGVDKEENQDHNASSLSDEDTTVNNKNRVEGLQSMDQTMPGFATEHHTILGNLHKGRIKDFKLEDDNLEGFLDALRTNTTFEGTIDLSGHFLTDQSLLKISKILENEKPVIKQLNLSGNTKIGAEGLKELGATLIENTNLMVLNLGSIVNEFVGCCRLIECLALNHRIEELDLGIIGSKALEYLGDYLSKFKHVKYLTIEEDQNEKWSGASKEYFIKKLETARACPILSINIKSDRMDEVMQFVGSLSLIFEIRRNMFILAEESEHQNKVLDIETYEIENLDNEELLDSFTIKKYIDNVFKNNLVESLALIKKHQNNVLRTMKKVEQTGESMDKIWEDSNLFTSEGCTFALALMLFQKIQNE